MAKRRTASPTPLSQLLTPLVLAVLALIAALIWLATVSAAERQRGGLNQMGTPAVHKTDAANAPSPFTAAFVSGLVPLPENASRIYLYASPTTDRYLKSVAASHESLLAPWRHYLSQRNIVHSEVNRLDVIIDPGTAVLILPSSVALDAEERHLLLDYQRQGGSILSTWAPGARNGNGEWQGYDFLERLFGVTVSGELDAESDARFLNLYGDLPLTVGYPAGRRIWLENTAEQALRLTGGKQAANYMNWIRASGSNPGSAAVLFDESGEERRHARWVVFGFAETSWGSQSDKLAGLLDNALHWLARGTMVSKATWPLPYRAAYLFEMDTEEGFANARRFAELMDEAGVSGTFYCLTSEAIRYPYLVRALSRRHEIAFHGDLHNGFRGQPEETQRRRLEGMQAEMKTILGDQIRTAGFRAPLEEYDRITERLLHMQGFLHHAADPNRTDARLPLFSPEGIAAPDKALVVLPRTQHDDIGLKAGERKPGAEKILLRTLVGDFHGAMQMGGLGLLSVHSQYFAKDSMLNEVMPDLLSETKKYREQIWITKANDIADWWRERERLRYAVSGTSDSFSIDVTIDGERPLAKGAIIVTHRDMGIPLNVQTVSGDAKAPEQKRLDAFRTALVFDGMAPGSYSFRVDQAPLRSSSIDAGIESKRRGV